MLTISQVSREQRTIRPTATQSGSTASDANRSPFAVPVRKHGSAIVAVLFILNASWAFSEDRPKVVVLGTVDGSRLTGIVATERIPLATQHGDVKLPMAEIEKVRFDKDHALARVFLANGDRLSGQVQAERVELTTAVGPLSVPWAEVAELSAAPDQPVPEDVIYVPAPPRPIRFEVSLHDGSSVRGTPDRNRVACYCAWGRIDLPWALVRKVSFHEDRETCTLELWNGDALVGCVDWRGFGLATGLGSVHVSTVHAREIHLSLGGIDLVAKPYESATGDSHFMSSLKSPLARRVQGRIYPASQLIEAHAGGRIEYVFDQPIREFHAVVSMYETYCAKKGSVIFKVETEHGPVYSSRPIGNHDQEDVYLRFPPSKRLVLITDPNGSNQEDWSVWLHPECR
jgi:hypothetical protein